MSRCRVVAVLPNTGDEIFVSVNCFNNLIFESTRLEHGKVTNSKLFVEAKTDSENIDNGDNLRTLPNSSMRRSACGGMMMRLNM